MGHTIRRFSPAAILLVPSLLPWGAPSPARAADTKPILLDVRVPADAELVVDGYKTQSTGEERHFESPPVEIGKTYAYTVKVTWRGRTVSGRVRLGPDKLTTLDLREELQEAAPTAPDKGPEIVPDKRPATESDTKRKDDARSSPGQETAPTKPSATEPETKPESEPKPAPAKVPETPQKAEETPQKKAQDDQPKKEQDNPPLKGVETGPDVARKTAPDQPPDEKPTRPAPDPEPRSSSSLRIQSPVEVKLRPGRTRYVEVRVTAAGDSPLASEPKVQLSSTPGLRVVPWTASGFKDGHTVFIAGFAVTSEPSAVRGPRVMKIRASVGEDRAEQVLKVTVTP